MQPGAFVAVVADPGERAVDLSMKARAIGLSLRDTLLVLGPDRVSFILLFKRPGDGLLEGVGGLAVNACRVGTEDTRRPIRSRASTEAWRMNKPGEYGSTSGRWPPNVLLVEGPLVEKLGTQARFYPRFPDLPAAHAWVRKLLGTPLTA